MLDITQELLSMWGCLFPSNLNPDCSKITLRECYKVCVCVCYEHTLKHTCSSSTYSHTTIVCSQHFPGLPIPILPSISIEFSLFASLSSSIRQTWRNSLYNRLNRAIFRHLHSPSSKRKNVDESSVRSQTMLAFGTDEKYDKGAYLVSRTWWLFQLENFSSRFKEKNLRNRITHRSTRRWDPSLLITSLDYLGAMEFRFSNQSLFFFFSKNSSSRTFKILWFEIRFKCYLLCLFIIALSVFFLMGIYTVLLFKTQ